MSNQNENMQSEDYSMQFNSEEKTPLDMPTLDNNVVRSQPKKPAQSLDSMEDLSKIKPKENLSRGEIYFADLSPVLGSEQGGNRPVLIVQNNVGNKYSPTVIVASITSILTKAKLPTHVPIRRGQFGVPKDSTVLLEQLRTIDKRRLKEYIGRIDNAYASMIDRALLISLGLKSID